MFLDDLHIKTEELKAPFGFTSSLNIHWSTPGIYTLLGPNGAGKSTLLRLISGVYRPISGQVILNHLTHQERSPKQRSHLLAYLPQEAPIAPLWTASEVIEQGLIPYLNHPQQLQKAQEERDWICERLKIQSLLSRKMQTLSGGERRKVLIARTLSQTTRFIILDEPLAALDWPTQEEFMNILSEVSVRRQAMVILSLHELNLAWLFAEHVLLLSKGKVISAGTPKQALTEQHLQEAFGRKPLLITHPQQDQYQHLPHILSKRENRQ